MILYFMQIFIFFCRICSACLSKTRPRFQVNVLRIKFFSNKILFASYFQNLSGKLSYFAFNLQSSVQSAFQLSRGTFSGEFRFW